MTRSPDEDSLEGDVGRHRGRKPADGSLFPGVSAVGSSKRAQARSRAAWFNRNVGSGRVRLATPRPPLSQRVIVKARVVVHASVAGKGGSAGSLMRHALYVERDGAGRDGDPVQVFDRHQERADGAAFVTRCEDDRHHFRIILSPEYGDDLADLNVYTRDLMAQVETDLGCRIDWIAAEHHDTSRPHVHILIRGRRDDGRDLVIPREYISHTFRQRAEEIATRELGLRLDQSLGDELDRRSERAAKLERPTHLDETLRAHARHDEVQISDLPENYRLRGPLVQRLNRLEVWGLAQRTSPDRWKLVSDLESRLRQLGDRRDQERATARLLAREDRGLEPGRARMLEAAHTRQRVTGRLVGFEPLGSDASGSQLVGVEGIDGRFWTARVSRLENLRALNGVQRGAVVAMHRAPVNLKPADRTILRVAGEDLVYSTERHRAIVPSDRGSYIQMHVRRLEALRREGVVQRTSDGVFRLPPDYEHRIIALEGRGGRESARLELLDPHPLAKQVTYHGPTWLDRMADGGEDKSQLRYEGFGEEARAAWLKRESTLRGLGLGDEGPEGFDTTQDWQQRLKQMEREGMLQSIEQATGLVPHFARDGDRVDGIFASRIHAAETSYALILQERTATLIPWRPDIDRALNQFVSGRVNGRDFDFKYGRDVEMGAKALDRIAGLDR